MHVFCSTRVLVALAAFVVCGVAAAVAVGSVAGVRNGHRFTSARYGYSLVVPTGWVVHPSASPHPANSPYLPKAEDPSADRFTSPGRDFGVIVVTATRVAPGLTHETWSAGTPKRVQLSFGCIPGSFTRASVGGEPAAVFVIPPSCGATGYAGVDYAVAHDGYGYDVELVSLPSYRVRDRAIFSQLLKSFRFTR
jgi:hypothetical protein